MTHCGHVYHENCISCWMNISDSCPICKTDTECTKLYLDITNNDTKELEEEIDILKNTIAEYKRLAMAQSKSIATKSYEIWESEMKIKEMKESNMRLKDTIKQFKIENQLKSNKMILEVNHSQSTPETLCLYPVFECTCNTPHLEIQKPTPQ